MCSNYENVLNYSLCNHFLWFCKHNLCFNSVQQYRRNKKECKGTVKKCPVLKEMINVGKSHGNETYKIDEKET